jgi:hypothetical protein
VRLLPAVLVLSASIAAGLPGCKRIESRSGDPVRVIGSRVEGRFREPADGRISEAQIDLYLQVRRAAGAASSDADAARGLGVSPAEFDWVRGRVIEALRALDAKRVADAALESYSRAIATLREARRGAGDPRAAARIDAEIAGLERERAALRKPDPLGPAVSANAARVAARRVAIESVGP